MEKANIDDFANIYSLSDLSVSPSGNALAFVRSQADVKENHYLSATWIMESGNCRKLTTGVSDASPLWLDEEHLLFPGDRKKAQKPAPGQAVTVYNRICPTRLCLFHGENHELSRSGKPKHRIRRLKGITE